MGSVNNEMNPWKTQQLGLGSLFGQGGQNPYQTNPLVQGPGMGPRQLPPAGGGPRQLPYEWDFGPQGGGPQQPTQQPTQNPWMSGIGLGGMANIAQIPGQMTGFGEQIGGFGEQMGGFGEQLGGYKDEFSGINDKLQNLEQGISSLTDKFGTQQQQQSPYQQNFGMNPFGSINPYTPFFGGLGAFMRRY